MLASFTDILPRRDTGQSPLGAFTCYGMEAVAGVLRAAERRSAPVMLLVSAQTFASPQGPAVLRTVRALADGATVPVCIQLDHVSDLELITRAFELGVQSVMADGSKLPFAQNVELVREARGIAAAHGGHVEAELGRIAGDEERATASTGSGFTDPAEAERFVAATGTACLAVSIGNVHGKYARTPELDIPRLRQIEERTDVPLSLHGASGLPAEQLGAALGGAIAKINVNTELRQRYVDVAAAQLPAVRESLDLLTFGTELIVGIAHVVDDHLGRLSDLSSSEDAR